MKPILIIYCALCIMNCALLCSCKAQKPVATTSHERIEQHVMPVAVGADTIEIICSQQTITPSPLRGTPPINKGRVIKSTRGINISRHETDTTSTLRITLRPDTVYVPYTTHIRSDTIIAPDPTTEAKLTSARWKMALLIIFIILILVIKIRRIIN